MNERPCKRKKTISLVGSCDVEEDYCPEQGMRQTSVVNSFSACPWVMTIFANSKTNELHCFQTLDDIPKQVVVPRDIQYFLAVVFLHDGTHFRAISVDAKNPHGNHVIYDGMDSPSKRIQIFNSNDLTSQYAEGYSILELWYVKVETHLMHREVHLLSSLPLSSLGFLCHLPRQVPQLVPHHSQFHPLPSNRPGYQILETPATSQPLCR